MTRDVSNGPGRPLSLARAWRATRLALAFLTVVPVKFGEDETTAEDLAASRFAYPLVGAAIGLGLAALAEALRRLGAEPSLAAFLVLVAWVAASGGLHLDGFADTFDGIFLWGDPERRLAVMRDPHVGSFGVTALVLVVLGKYVSLTHLPLTSAPLALLGASMISRTLILVSAGSADYARKDGTGRILVDATKPREAVVAACVVLGLGVALAGWPGLLASGATLILAFGLTRLSRARLGGVTGDTLGALVELSEVTYLILMGLLHSS